MTKEPQGALNLNEDPPNQFVAVSIMRPHFYEAMQSSLLECETRYMRGDHLAIYDAVLYCERGHLTLPPWLVSALKGCVVASLTVGFRRTPEDCESPIARRRRELRMQVHYRTVRRVLNASLMRSVESPDADNTSQVRFVGACKTASKLLRGTFAQARVRTIAESFHAIEAQLKNDPYLSAHDMATSAAEPETLEAFGLQAEMNDVEISKWQKEKAL